MIEKICIFANLSIPYVYEEGFTTLEILKNLIKHTNEIIDEVKIPSICKKCLLRRECENCIDYAYENVTDNFSCEDFEPDV